MRHTYDPLIAQRIVYLKDNAQLTHKQIARILGKEFNKKFTRSQINHAYLRIKQKETWNHVRSTFPVRYDCTTELDIKGNVLVIADTHIPWEHQGYLDFCLRTRDEYQCEIMVHIGDVVDAKAMSFWGPDPDAPSAGNEYEQAYERLQRWYQEFPEMLVCVGNHDGRYIRKALEAGIPKSHLKAYEEVWGAPLGWEWGLSWEIQDVLYEHGIGTSGKNAAMNRAMDAGQSVVMGHLHYFPAIHIIPQRKRKIFGMNVGCGIDAKSLAFAYAKAYRKRPGLGCGVVLEDGTFPLLIPMNVV